MTLLRSALQNKVTLFAGLILNRQSEIYVGYVGRSNFGDDLLLDIYRRVTGRSIQPALDSFNFQPKQNRRAVLGGGTLIGGPIYQRTFARLGLKPSAVFCAGVIPGPIDKEWIDLLSGIPVYTRSKESTQRLLDIGLDAHALVDPAVFTSKIYGITPAPQEGPLLAVHGKHPHADVFSKLLEALPPEERTASTLFASSPEDMRLAHHLSQRHGTKVFAGWRDIEASVVTISKAAFVLSTRLHPAIVAASLGVPMRMLAYDAKHHEFAGSVQEQSLLISPETHSLADLIALGNLPRQPCAGIVNWTAQYGAFQDQFR